MVQACSAWCSALSRSSPATEIRRRPVLRFPRPQDEDSIFRMQRCASMNPCGGLSHRRHTCTQVWRYEGSTSIEDHDVAFVNQLLGMSLGSRCHSHHVVRCELLQSILPDCQSFHVLGPRIVVLSLSPFDGFKSSFGHSSGFTTDSPAP